MTMMGKTLLLTLLLLSSVFSIASSRRRHSNNNNIDWWCNQTPYPEPCRYYIKHSHYQHKQLKHKSEFRTILVHLALERAVIMRRKARELGGNGVTKKQKSVFRDCLKLYDNTVFHLNRTLEGLHVKTSCSPFDAQTWLSTARTNIETCQNWALELGIRDSMVPAERCNLTEIISNGLFVNWAFLKYREAHYTADAEEDALFPRWFSMHERKLLQSSSIRAHLVVAKDGSGHFRSVQAAINAAARRRLKSRFIIHVKRGVYRENIEVDKTNDNVMLVGDGMRNTIITSARSVQAGYTTYSSATAGIDGLHFIARDITFRNTAGPLRGQAVALRSASDLSVFYRCAIEGYQDTLMVHAQRQFYRGCYIYGTVDFIFGNAAVVFQNCVILVRKPLNGQANMITAQGRDDPFQNTGFSIHNSQIRAAPDLRPIVGKFNTFLGRPWQRYSRVVVMKSFLDSLVSPRGWSPWGDSNFALNTLYYGEYRNFGPGSSTRNRVRWPGFHRISSPAEASRFTVANLLAGRTWLPATGVPFTSGL
ncbi:probable pectinesterase/pectinesterase inhibitor 33 [Glycine soja]|uniref:Pectinesterase n=1 Tax=Glycine soja TaxID=3848 RepID=A0A445J5A2_GLYSO|nr:probable pectinesterase/pectinesterase inhibitor 33 [Glycine soja]RZB93475.1 putative pectinesterase/pectinesterase inhibitor 33 [Glycine soja]